MSSSVYLAFLFGSYIFVISASMIWNRSRFIETMTDVLESRSLIFFTGILVLMGGVSVVCFHTVWALDWRGLITLIGWIAVIKGTLLIILPEPLIAFSKGALRKPSTVLVLGVTYLAIGSFFIVNAIIEMGRAV